MSERTSSSTSQAPSGQVTQAMRAAPAGGPRVLRLGLVRGGRVIEERVLKDREPVTIGSNENNTFVIAASRIPHEFRLFDVESGRYVLQFTDAMSGKVALPDGLTQLSDLKGTAQRRGEFYRLPLPEDVRGKVVIGDCAFLFQFVSPPPAQPKPQLPVSVMRGAVGIDWATTMIAAFSFLAHFMAIGAIYSDWLDPVVDYDVNLANLVENFKNLPPPPEVEEKNVEEKDEKKEEDKAPEAKPVEKVAQKDPTQKTKMSKAEVAALAEQLDSFDMGILGAQTGKTATSDILSSSDSIATGIMDQAAASGAGVSGGGPGGLKLTGAGGALQAGQGGSSLSSIGSSGKTGGESSGGVAVVKGPKGSANVGSANVAVGQISDASRVIARMRPGFHACYTSGLQTNPDAAGKISLKIQVGAGGEVTGVSASVSGNLPSDVVECVKRRARGGRFNPPEGGTAVVDVPVSFVKQ
jgi:hypothetical protein